MSINKDTIVIVLLAVLAASIVITKAIDALRATGTIPDGKAGYWNQVISFVTALVGFILHYIGSDDKIAGAQNFGLQLAAVVVTGFSIMVLARGIHAVMKWVEEHRKPVVASGGTVKVDDATNVTVNQK